MKKITSYSYISVDISCEQTLLFAGYVYARQFANERHLF